MKYLIKLLVVLFIHINTKAVNVDSLFKVSYRVTHQLDSNDKNSVVYFPMSLYIGSNLSRFVSPNKLYNDSITKNAQIIKDENTKSIRRVGGMKRNTVAEEKYEYYKDFNQNQSIVLGSIAIQQFRVMDKLNDIIWQLGEKYKVIAGIRCQMATASYKGRKWIAWYAPHLLNNNGPWKLGGLPGLILSATDEKGEITFTFENIEKVIDAGQLKLPSSSIPTTTREEFNKIYYYIIITEKAI